MNAIKNRFPTVTEEFIVTNSEGQLLAASNSLPFAVIHHKANNGSTIINVKKGKPVQFSDIAAIFSDKLCGLEAPVITATQVKNVVPVIINRIPEKEIVAPVLSIELTEPKKRGRKVVYETSNMKVDDTFIYNGPLSSARVMASLNGKKHGWKFKAYETVSEDHTPVVFIKRMA